MKSAFNHCQVSSCWTIPHEHCHWPSLRTRNCSTKAIHVPPSNQKSNHFQMLPITKWWLLNLSQRSIMVLSYLFCHSLIHSLKKCISDAYRLCSTSIVLLHLAMARRKCISFRLKTYHGYNRIADRHTDFGKRNEMSCRCSYRHRRHSIRNLFSFSFVLRVVLFMECFWSFGEARLMGWMNISLSFFPSSSQSQNLNTNLYYAKNCLQFKETSR